MSLRADAASQRLATVSLPPATLRAQLAPATFDDAARTVDIVWTTGARVERDPFWGDPYTEELEVSEHAVDLGRLRNGANLLEAHRSWGLDGVLGVVERAWIAGSEGHATVRFSTRPKAEEIFQEVRAGIIRSVSVGYITHEVEELPRKKGERLVRRATRWEPVELSLVAVGADAGAHVRGAGDPAALYPCLVRRIAMGTQATGRGGGGDPDATPAGDDAGTGDDAGGDQDAGQGAGDAGDAGAGEGAGAEKPGARAAAAERTRITTIQELVRRLSLPETVAADLIRRGTPLGAASAVILRTAEERQPAIGGAIRVGADGAAALFGGMRAALLHRIDPARHAVTDAARPWVARSLFEMARESLLVRRVRVDAITSRLELAGLALRPTVKLEARQPQGFLTTSDFAGMLAQMVHVSLTEGYTAAPRTFPPWTRQTTLPDFKKTMRVSLGGAPALLEVPEHAEYSRGALAATAEPLQLKTFGRIVAITRQAIINDDLDVISKIPTMYGYAAAQMESDAVYGILTGNPTLSDGQPLFSAAHQNLAPAAGITVDSMSVARTLMATQKSPEGEFLGLTPGYIICGPLMETAAYAFVFPTVVVVAGGQAAPDPLRRLSVIVDPRIEDASWYLSAPPAQIDTIEYAYLAGAAGGGPETFTKDGWDIDGTEIKAREDFGAAAIEYRGLVKTPSTTTMAQSAPAGGAEGTITKQRKA